MPVKGLDADGNAFEQEVDASKINPNNCGSMNGIPVAVYFNGILNSVFTRVIRQ